ncbi:HAMP domain-containing histidine kinase [Paenibacillus sp. MER TA 81-3]|uniref:HAMP domain-containing sensor histidine kinase n=1 Tax=Paenibacillus sp. MER TA 81-3 TaxID=2939573 RepID=UPI0020408A6E|nr:HAMP domain-containing sensor histidine kinase [Paenibacillus sp. MER TA 81-3]MCM3340905.1 HAMP domain-containing histidine kinase [Paenibacillus sp. MER TA 81-3]
MKKGEAILKIMGGVCLVVAVVTIGTWIAFYGTEALYKYIGIHLHSFAAQWINVLLVFFIFGCTMYLISLIVGKKHYKVWDKIIEALRKISRGDFSVSLDIRSNENDPLGKIVSTINQMAVELGELEKMRQDFISNVSHEIQSPLTSIHGFANVLKRADLTHEERQHYVTIIEMESNRLSKISENLLKLTSLESQHHPFEPTRYRLDKQLRSAMLACEPAWLEKDLEMELECEAITVTADEDLMSQVWNNLITNSVKFTANGGTIRIRVYARSGNAFVAISDTGIGMNDEDMKRIFERFYKADKSRTSEKGGSGLGLSIVKKIVEMHEGSIAVQSKIDGGTSFEVVLPLEAASQSSSR